MSKAVDHSYLVGARVRLRKKIAHRYGHMFADPHAALSVVRISNVHDTALVSDGDVSAWIEVRHLEAVRENPTRRKRRNGGTFAEIIGYESSIGFYTLTWVDNPQFVEEAMARDSLMESWNNPSHGWTLVWDRPRSEMFFHDGEVTGYNRPMRPGEPFLDYSQNGDELPVRDNVAVGASFRGQMIFELMKMRMMQIVREDLSRRPRERVPHHRFNTVTV